MAKSIIYCLLFSILLIITACGEEERSSLNVEERRIVNTRYKEALDSINKLLITECTDRREKKFNHLVDSLKTTRLQEIELITKVKRNEK